MWYHTKYKFNNNFILAGNICGPFIIYICMTFHNKTTYNIFCINHRAGNLSHETFRFFVRQKPCSEICTKKMWGVFLWLLYTYFKWVIIDSTTPSGELLVSFFFLSEVGNLFIINKLFSWFLENFANPLKILCNPSLRNAGVNQPPTIYKLLKCMIPTQKGKQKKNL